uniref:Putative secreted protein n=1 Tax=Psorophora albipes TaxID=869069 RepID=T1D5S8_9DIPT
MGFWVIFFSRIEKCVRVLWCIFLYAFVLSDSIRGASGQFHRSVVESTILHLTHVRELFLATDLVDFFSREPKILHTLPLC